MPTANAHPATLGYAEEMLGKVEKGDAVGKNSREAIRIFSQNQIKFNKICIMLKIKNMRKLFFFLCSLMVGLSSFAQLKGVTENGDEVILYTDGTWKYTDKSKETLDTIPVNKKLYSKGKTATFLVKSKKIGMGIWIDPKKWTFSKAAEGDAAEFEFDFKQNDAYAILIAERTGIPLENMPVIALENARDAAPDIKISQKEFRIVNGKKYLMIKMEGTAQGVKFYYFGYYYSTDDFTVQLVSYTSKNLFDTLSVEMESFLNGLDELQSN